MEPAPAAETGTGWGVSEDTLKRRLLFLVMIIFNASVVLTLKGAFTYYLLSNDSSFSLKLLLEISLAAFDVMWGFNAIPFVVGKFQGITPVFKIVLKSFLLWFNNVVSPCLVVAVAGTSCFKVRKATALFDRVPSARSRRCSLTQFYLMMTTIHSTFHSLSVYALVDIGDFVLPLLLLLPRHTGRLCEESAGLE